MDRGYLEAYAPGASSDDSARSALIYGDEPNRLREVAEHQLRLPAGTLMGWLSLFRRQGAGREGSG
jgi:hypothetical protein